MCETALVILNLIIAVIGVCFVLFGLTEYLRLKKLRDEVEKFRSDIDDHLYRMQKAMSRVMASYQTDNPVEKISLLESALSIYPDIFNGYNSLGYALLEQGKTIEAISVFQEAIHRHPDDRAGYFDLAHAVLKNGNRDLCIRTLRKAVEVDPDAKQDLRNNPLFEEIAKDPEFNALLQGG